MSKEAPPPYDGNAPGPGFVPQGGQYPPPPQHGGPPPPPQQHTVIVTTTTAQSILGPNAMATTCPHCHAAIVTTVETEANTKTHLFAILLCAFGCWPCCFIPYCMDSCQSKKHFCPNCRAYLGTYSD